MKWSREQKRNLTPQALCDGRAAVLIPFVEKIFKLSYYDKPEYDDLVKVLSEQALLLNANKSVAYRPANVRCLSPEVSSIKNQSRLLNLQFAKTTFNDCDLDKDQQVGNVASNSDEHNQVPKFQIKNKPSKRFGSQYSRAPVNFARTTIRLPKEMLSSSQTSTDGTMHSSPQNNASCGFNVLNNFFGASKAKQY